MGQLPCLVEYTRQTCCFVYGLAFSNIFSKMWKNFGSLIQRRKMYILWYRTCWLNIFSLSVSDFYYDFVWLGEEFLFVPLDYGISMFLCSWLGIESGRKVTNQCNDFNALFFYLMRPGHSIFSPTAFLCLLADAFFCLFKIWKFQHLFFIFKLSKPFSSYLGKSRK